MELKTVNLNSINAFNKLHGLPTYHPLVNVFDMKDATNEVNNVRLEYGIYAIFLKNGVNCSIRYGRKNYDYQEGTVVSFSPGQVIDVVNDKPASGNGSPIGLIFHPDLIYGTPLAEKIASFGFFDYSQMESLHLSSEERGIFLDCLGKIGQEIRHSVDHHSAPLLSANIQLLLEYLHRFYDRQFITRHKVNSDVVAQFEKDLKEVYSPNGTTDVMPSVAYFADRVNLSPGYFGELIKKETGTTAKEIITNHVISVAKHRLTVTNNDINEIAYGLGFEYPAHFTRLFKRVTGQSPTLFRRLMEQN